MSQLVTRPSGAIAVADSGPLVSAILFTANQESHLRECLCGLMEQTLAGSIEVIVVDQGSQQCEASVVADLQRSHQNVLFLKIPQRSAGRGINMALKIASGRYVTVLEATDRLNRDAYQVLCAALEADRAAMVAYGDTCFTAIPHESFASHTSYGKVIWPDYATQQLSHLTEVAPHPLWRRELHDSVGFFDEQSPVPALRDFLLKAAGRFPMLHVQEFTGLKLIAANAQPTQAHPGEGMAQADRLQAGSPKTEIEPAAAIPAQDTTDEAYAKLGAVLAGPQWEEAASALREHLKRHPQHAVAHNDLAAVSYRLGDLEKALSHYREAVRLEPGEGVYQKNLADLLYVEAGEPDEAIAIYLRLLEKAPRDLEVLLNLGIICEGVGQPDEAESFYLRALEIEPSNQAARERLTALRAAAQEQDLTPAQGDDEQTAEERYQLSQELVGQGDLEGAERELKTILATYPDFAPAHNDLAVLSYQKGEKEQSRSHYERAAALAPGNSTFQKNLADYLFVEGCDVDGAIAIYLDQLKKTPRDIETLMGLGRICTMLDRPQEAESFYNKVTQLEPWNRDARECLSSLRQAANG